MEHITVEQLFEIIDMITFITIKERGHEEASCTLGHLHLSFYKGISHYYVDKIGVDEDGYLEISISHPSERIDKGGD